MWFRTDLVWKGWVLLLLLWGLGSPEAAQAQVQRPYGNEWINYAQTYYKLQVAHTGIYRLSQEYLTQAGISGVDPRKFQLFRRGQEVAIHVAGEADGSMDAGDFIEFFGERNDGKLDAELYKDPTHQAHPYYSLYTDTAAYFLTWSGTNGKRMLTDNPGAEGLTPASRVYQTQLDPRAFGFTYGKFHGDSRVPWMDQGEGFLVAHNSTLEYVFQGLQGVDPTGYKPVVDVVVAGAFGGNHELDIFVALPGGGTRPLGNIRNFKEHETRRGRYTLEFSDIAADGSVRIGFTPKGSNNDWFSLRFIKIKYPHHLALAGKSGFVSPDSTSASPSFLLFDTPPANAIAYDVTDPNNPRRVAGHEVGARKGFVVPASHGQERKILVSGSADIRIPVPAVPRLFRAIKPSDHNYVVVTHKKLTAPSGNYANPALAYAGYRASPAGGGFDTLVVMVDQLYDQFHYGERSASAIRRFMQYLQATGNPEYLLLLGKGYELQYRLGFFRTNPYTATEQDLVPTGGNPGSDIFFTADWPNNSFEPKVATGRVSAARPAEVVSYLEKVKLHESLGAQEWRKNVLHLGGGKTEQEINLFKTYLNNYKAKAEKPFFGGRVSSIYRNSTRDIVTNINVSRQVNEGLSLITFFGHSSATVSDIDIGNVSNPINGYRNHGKYPMILMNGCNSGNTFAGYSFGEDWILTPEKGAVLFIAHAHLGYPNLLNLYSANFYELAFNNPAFYGKPVGDIQREVIRQVMTVTASTSAQTMALQMVLQGDPAVSLFSPAKPDYAITNQSLTLLPVDNNPVTVASEAFSLAVDVKNLGKAIPDSIYISVKHTLPDNSVVITDSLLFPAVFLRDTLVISLNSPGAATFGINKFEVFVDHTETIDELNEDNNIGHLEYFFQRSGVSALYPPEYSIVSDPKVQLTGMAMDQVPGTHEFLFELATDAGFGSSIKSATVRAENLPVWEVNVAEGQSFRDSTVFFWRFRAKNIPAGTDTVWANSSFRFIAGSAPGWSQSHFDQFDKAVLKDLQRQMNPRGWAFGDTRKSVEVRGVGGNGGFAFPPYGIFVEGSSFINNSCGFGASNLLVAVFHPRTLERYTGMPSQTASLCGTAPASFYHFDDLTQEANRKRLEEFLTSIPEGFYVAALGMNKVPFQSFPPSLVAAFGTVGAALVGDLENNMPYALIGRKGDAPGAGAEVTAAPDDPTPADLQVITLFADLVGKGSKGTLTSSRIGPAREWGTLFHQVEQGQTDGYTLSVIGIDREGKEQVLMEEVKTPRMDLSAIDALQYPYLQLNLQTTDEKDRTPVQLKQWIVTFTGLPEGVIRPDLVERSRYTLSGQAVKSTVTFPFIFQNISNYAFTNPITAEVRLTGADGTQKIENILLRPLAVNDSIRFHYTIPSKGLGGENRMRVFFNPNLLPELNYLNNIFEFTFTVPKDDLHPVLDVVFDGLHLMDGDIVSPSPAITMTLKDENKNIPLEDADLMEVFLRYPDSEEFVAINQASHAAEIQVVPGTDKTPFQLTYHPKQLPDGKYELRVQGRDVAGNASGKEMYRINFEVINASTITRFYPYPNPFSTSTRFVFTLTGGSIPDNLKIQIMTITGKVVREIMAAEIGPLRIGNNMTQMAWDGTDEFGDKLANGVYLYRVVIDRKNEEFKHRNSAGDKAFKQDFGKVYILR